MFTKNSQPVAIRAAAILTGSYVAGTTIQNAHNYNQLTIEVDYTQGSLTSLEIKVEFSRDGVTFFQDINISPSSGVNTIIPSSYTYTGAAAKFSIDLAINTNFIKVSAKGTGTATSSSLAISGTLALV